MERYSLSRGLPLERFEVELPACKLAWMWGPFPVARKRQKHPGRLLGPLILSASFHVTPMVLDIALYMRRQHLLLYIRYLNATVEGVAPLKHLGGRLQPRRHGAGT